MTSYLNLNYDNSIEKSEQRTPRRPVRFQTFSIMMQFHSIKPKLENLLFSNMTTLTLRGKRTHYPDPFSYRLPSLIPG